MFPWSCVKKNKDKICLKIWDYQRVKRVGVVVGSLEDLKSSIHSKFEMRNGVDIRVVFENDGTEIDDNEVFLALEPQTVLMVLEKGQKWEPDMKGKVEEVEKALAALRKSDQRREIANELRKRVQDEKDPEMVEILGHLHSIAQQNIHAETIEEDPNWFEGQPQSKRTKSSVMRESAKRRVRSYYNTAFDYFKGAKKRKLTESEEEILDNFQMALKTNSYYADYFDRGSDLDDIRLCDSDGWFKCEGAFNVDECSYLDHRINPYGSKTNYLVFSTWNLDHVIEKSREVLPRLEEAQAKIPRGKELNWEYFYDLLFTRQNLKLVHISCHDKSQHESEKCDPSKFYVSA